MCVRKESSKATHVFFKVYFPSCISYIICLSSMMLNITYCKCADSLLQRVYIEFERL